MLDWRSGTRPAYGLPERLASAENFSALVSRVSSVRFACFIAASLGMRSIAIRRIIA